MGRQYANQGEYQVYVHHYKKHKKRRTKDPTKFKVIVNNVESYLSLTEKYHMATLKLVAQFDVPTSEQHNRGLIIRAEMKFCRRIGLSLTANQQVKMTRKIVQDRISVSLFSSLAFLIDLAILLPVDILLH